MAFIDIFDADKRSKKELREEIASRNEQIVKLGETLAQVRASAADERRHAAKAALSSKSGLSSSEERSLRSEISSMRTRLATKEDTVVSLRKQIKQVENSLSRKESDNAALRRQIEELEAHRNASPITVSTAGQPSSGDAAALSSNGDEPIEATRQSLAAAEQQIVKQSQQLAEQEAEIKRLAKLYADERSLRKEKECTIYNIKFNYDKLKQTVGDTESIKKQYEQLRSNSVTSSEHKRISDELRKKCDAETKQREKAQNKLARLEVALNTAKDELVRLKTTIKSLQKQQNVKMSPNQLQSAFLHPKVLSWLLEDVDARQTPDVPNGWLGYSGESPFSEVLFYESLKGCGFEFWNLPDSDLRHLILGQRDWSESKLFEQIDASDAGQLRIYSQEMFIAKLITGRDPFDASDDELLYAFAENHAALTYLIDLSRPWPEICFSTGNNDEFERVDSPDEQDFKVSASPMALLGYQVGVSSPLTTTERRRLLTKIFEQMRLEFSEDSSPSYIKKWGRGCSAQRLYRMAVHIKWLVETQGKDHRKTQARDEWISDLDWLRRTYYARVMHIFAWP